MNTGISEAVIRKYLAEKDIAHADLGHRYLIYGIRQLTDGTFDRHSFLVWDIYESTAEEYLTKPECVERAIRASIRKSVRHDGQPSKHRTNKEFIACAADELMHGS